MHGKHVDGFFLLCGNVSCRELNRLYRTFKLLIDIWIKLWFRDFSLCKGLDTYVKEKMNSR